MLCLGAAWGRGQESVKIPDAAEVELRPVFEGAAFVLKRPVWVGEVPGKVGWFLVLEQQEGMVALVRGKDGAWVKEAFYQLGVSREGEGGLLGLAFHPSFASNRKYYLLYNPKTGGPATIVEEREAGADFTRDAGKSGRQVLKVPQEHDIHQGGMLAFGPKDGMLYVGLGDGGDSKPAQDRRDLRGKMLRLDLDGGVPYRIPADNPFVAEPGTRPEIFALGLRNPWRWSFDAVTGELWAGDVGEIWREEITAVPRGGNLGWDRREGLGCRGGLPGCLGEEAPEGPFTEPWFEYDRGGGAAVIGGMVYRGDPASPLYGTYFFADHLSGEIRALKRLPDGRAEARTVGKAPGRISSFGTDRFGNLYVTGLEDGQVWRLASPHLGAIGIREAAERQERRGRIFALRRGGPLRLPGRQDGNVAIFDAGGRARAELRIEHGAMETSNLEPGLYEARPAARDSESLRLLILP